MKLGGNLTWNSFRGQCYTVIVVIYKYVLMSKTTIVGSASLVYILYTVVNYIHYNICTLL